MSAEEQAYEAALRLIAKAKREGGQRLDLNTTETHALTRLPPEIHDLPTLRSLDLDNTRIIDFSPLTGLTGLTTLSLSHTRITDLSPLTGLTGLTGLFLDNTQISDLSPLSALTGLTTLSLGHTQISDLSPLSALTGLTRLYLSHTQITDLSPLTALTGLTELTLNNTQISDLSPLSGLTGLTRLSLIDTQISDLSPLSGLTRLTELFLDDTRISDLSRLTALTGLTTLYLNNTQISDFSPLTALTGLTGLSLNNTQISDLSPLTALTGLTTLYLSNTRISDLTPLASLNALTCLYLDNSAALDLRPLRGLAALGEHPTIGGLTFRGTPATRADAGIKEIAKIEDNGTRARELFAHLENWKPPVGAGLEAIILAPSKPTFPASLPAPVLPVVTEERIGLAKGPDVLAASNANTRAQQGWLALSEFRASFGGSFHIENYAPLPAILRDFDRAMGANFASCRPIAVGMHGQRIIAQSYDQGLLETLPSGAGSELKAFAAAIATFVERFPDWQAYNADTPSDAEHGMTDQDRSAFAAVDQVVDDTPQADQDFKDEFHAIVSLGSDSKATEIEMKGLDSSTRELALALGQVALREIKSGASLRRETEEMARVGQGEWAKIKWYAGGFTLDALQRASPSLRLLAKNRPKSFGWLTALLDYAGTP